MNDTLNRLIRLCCGNPFVDHLFTLNYDKVRNSLNLILDLSISKLRITDVNFNQKPFMSNKLLNIISRHLLTNENALDRIDNPEN